MPIAAAVGGSAATKAKKPATPRSRAMRSLTALTMAAPPVWGEPSAGLVGGERRSALQPLAGALFHAFGAQLPAGGEDVAPARRADGGGIAGAVEHFGEFLDRLPVR